MSKIKCISFEYDRGYFKALMDVCGLLENSKQKLKEIKSNNIESAIKIINKCLTDKERLIDYGSDLKLYFVQSEVKKGKKTVKELSVYFDDDEEVIKLKNKIQQNYNNPCSKSHLSHHWIVYRSVHSEKVAVEYFKDEFGNNFSNLDDDAKEFYRKIVGEENETEQG